MITVKNDLQGMENIWKKGADMLNVRPQALTDGMGVTNHEVSPGPLMDMFASTTYDVVKLNLDMNWTVTIDGKSREITVDDIRLIFRFAVYARVAQVNDEYRLSISPKDFEYPSVLGPILATIGIYDDVSTGTYITPELPADGRTLLKGKILVVPHGYKEIVRALRLVGMNSNYGLPKDKVTSDPDCYMLAIDDEGTNSLIIGAHDRVKPNLVLARTLIKISALTELYGRYGVLYGMVNQARSSLESIVMSALHCGGAALIR